MRWRGALVSMGIALVTACYNGDALTGPDGEGTPPDSTDVPTNPSFANDVTAIFTAGGCTATSCHGGGADGLTLTSSAATNYSNLVGVRSSSAPTFLRVEPGDPTNSYLVMKLEGRQLSGGRMPLGRPPLSNAQIGTIKTWISAGALNN